MNLTFNGDINSFISLKQCFKNSNVSFSKRKAPKLEPLNKDEIVISNIQDSDQPVIRKIELNTSAIPTSTNIIDGVEVPVYKYDKRYPRELKATPNPKIRGELLQDKGVKNIELAINRLTNFSRYLKEDMVGFYTPDGKHWFEGACKYLIEGSAGIDIPESMYPEYATKFWELLSKADKFWISDEFVDYLKSMEQNPGVVASINAIENINNAINARNSNITFGYSSELRFIPELLKHGGAYTGQELVLSYKEGGPHPLYPTLEHLFPHIAGGDEANDNCNYVLTTSESNSSRSDIPLIDFLKGWDGDAYYAKNPNWKKSIIKTTKIKAPKEITDINELNLTRKEK
ncbi:MAG: hypothetical protein AB1782_04365, partial [Cyanobacteriota bacterium]